MVYKKILHYTKNYICNNNDIIKRFYTLLQTIVRSCDKLIILSIMYSIDFYTFTSVKLMTKVPFCNYFRS